MSEKEARDLVKYLLDNTTPTSRKAMESDLYANILRTLRRPRSSLSVNSELANDIERDFDDITRANINNHNIKIFKSLYLTPLLELFAEIELCEIACGSGREYIIPDNVLQKASKDNFYFFVNDELNIIPITKWRERASNVIEHFCEEQESCVVTGGHRWKRRPNLAEVSRIIQKFNSTNPINTYSTIIARKHVLRDLGISDLRSSNVKYAITREEMQQAARYAGQLQRVLSIPLIRSSRVSQIVLSSYASVYQALSNGIIFLWDRRRMERHKIDLKGLECPESIRRRIVINTYKYFGRCLDRAYGKYRRDGGKGTSAVLNAITAQILDEIFHLRPVQIKKIVAR